MKNKSILLSAVCILCIVISLTFYIALRNVKIEFNEKKAQLVKENLDLTDRLESIQASATKNTQLEKEKSDLEAELKLVKAEIEKLRSDNDSLVSMKRNLFSQLSLLKKKYLVLVEKVTQLEGRPIALTPIVVKGGEQAGKLTAEKTGKVLLVDAKNSLIIVDLGAKNEVEKGNRCVVIKDEQEIASGEIINVRYKESAVFVENLKYGNKINDIKAGFKVLINK